MADETEPAMFDALEKALMPLNSARQLAELSGIGESTLAEWRGTHTGPAYVKSGRRVLYPKEAVLGFMRANLRECKEASARPASRTTTSIAPRASPRSNGRWIPRGCA